MEDIETEYDSSSDEEIFLESLWDDDISTDDFSSSNDEEERRVLVRSVNFVEKVVPQFDDRQFPEHFRIKRSTFEHLQNLVLSAQILSCYRAGRENVTTEKGLLIMLWYLANQETYRQVSDRFNVTISTVFIIVRKLVLYFVSISNTYIKWPTQQQAEGIAHVFARREGLEGVIGAIDASHISINRPSFNQSAYCNRKGTHSIILQGVVDDRKCFTSVYCGETGCNHDARVLRRSSLYHQFHRDGLPNGTYLLGDSAYPELSWLVVPYKDNGLLTQNEYRFNYRHSATRIVVENSFGLLKGRFRRLRHFDNINIHFIVEAVVTACVLHNICINMDDWVSDNYIDTNLMDPDLPPDDFHENSGIDRRQLLLSKQCNVII